MMLRQVRYLIAVLDHGSFTRAAEALRISQPALSQRIKQLEDMLGAKLLDRSSNQIKATDAGRVYISYAQQAIKNLDAGSRAIHDVEELTEGSLRLGFSPLFTTHFVGPVVQQFHTLYPGIKLTVDILTQAKLEKEIVDDQYDIGLGFGDLVTHEDVEIEPLHEEQLCLIVGRNNPTYHNKYASVRDLDHMDLALLNGAFVTRATIDLYLSTNAVRSRIALEANSVDSLVTIVQRSSRLATIMPHTTAQGFSDLKALQLQPPIATRTTAALTRKTGYRSAAAKAFLTLLKKWAWSPQSGCTTERKTGKNPRRARKMEK